MNAKQELNTSYVYLFECVNFCLFYGDQKLTKKGQLFCPNCEAPQRIDSPYVEKIRVINNER